MRASIFYRTAAVLLLIFAVGHTLGFRDADPAWGIDAVLASMQSRHFAIQGFTRTYWDFFVGAGFTIGALYLFVAVLAWQLGSLPRETLAALRPTVWGFAGCFAVVTAVSWQYLFWIPIIVSGGITLCLVAGAYRSGRGPEASAPERTRDSQAARSQ